MGARKRLDTLLVERGLFESRAKAASSVIAGVVRLGPGQERAAKPGTLVSEDVEVEVARAPRYVSRGGLKLERALDCFGISPLGRLCLDLGASTGGFSDCLLQGGAAGVATVDVGYGELHWKLRQDPRITVLERQNARALTPDRLPYAPNLVVVDLSFIGLAKVLPAVVRCAASRFDLVALVKPQFELGPVGCARERGGGGARPRPRGPGLLQLGPAGAGRKRGELHLVRRRRARRGRRRHGCGTGSGA
jgi:23S rRNA (cytidine1920-2'-O)/16S rRNA (cytidine1409-2'-O)-methyltransferase